MVNVHVDQPFTDEERRARLFAGDVVVYTQLPEVRAFAEFTRELVRGAFAPHAPTTVHLARGRDELADILIDFKPRFIHHPGVDRTRAADRLRGGRGPRPDPRRCAQAAHRVPARQPEHRYRLRLPAAPRHLVRGPAAAGHPCRSVAAGHP